MKLSDILSGALVLLLGAFVVLYARTFPPMPGQPVGPALFPSIIGAGLILLGAGLVLSGRRWSRGPLVEKPDWFGRPRMVANFALVIGDLLLYAAVVGTLGFIVTSIIFLSLLMFGFGVRRAWILPLAAVITLAVHAGFYSLLRVPLPWGVLERIAW